MFVHIFPAGTDQSMATFSLAGRVDMEGYPLERREAYENVLDDVQGGFEGEIELGLRGVPKLKLEREQKRAARALVELQHVHAA